MNNDFSNITSNEFCDLQGISDNDRFVINKKFKGTKSYDDWYNTIQAEFQVGAKKEEFKIAEKPVKAKTNNK